MTTPEQCGSTHTTVTARAGSATPLLEHGDYGEPSVFTPENLLHEARRQKKLSHQSVPAICAFDPDGDMLDYLQATGRARRHLAWACYHTELYTFEHDGITMSLIGRVVGASFAVLVAEELFVSGCRLLISITSAGQIVPLGPPPYIVLLERALRDEGTSYHYLPPARYSTLRPELRAMLYRTWDQQRLTLHIGASWTTDAPFRETATTIAAYREEGIVAVEMEAAALYALAEAKQYEIICFAHVTNQMAQQGDDFEKGPDQGSHAALTVIGQVARIWRSNRAEPA
ncbi:MAG: nucleoside phosphorylase [Herpetosiphonaceae bacterium]|nr:nucleoside phosphorylase [Herpetosiphonaceae bacterium]